MPAQYFDEEGTLVRCRGGGYVIDGVDDAVQRGVRTDRHICADQVVVDGSNQADHPKVLMAAGVLIADFPLVAKLTDVLGPLVLKFF